MKEQTKNPPAQIETAPHQVWQTLTATQQQVVWQTIVQICHHLAQQWRQERRNEPRPNT
jgi:hypothetical protein